MSKTKSTSRAPSRGKAKRNGVPAKDKATGKPIPGATHTLTSRHGRKIGSINIDYSKIEDEGGLALLRMIFSRLGPITDEDICDEIERAREQLGQLGLPTDPDAPLGSIYCFDEENGIRCITDDEFDEISNAKTAYTSYDKYLEQQCDASPLDDAILFYRIIRLGTKLLDPSTPRNELRNNAVQYGQVLEFLDHVKNLEEDLPRGGNRRIEWGERVAEEMLKLAPDATFDDRWNLVAEPNVSHRINEVELGDGTIVPVERSDNKLNVIADGLSGKTIIKHRLAETIAKESFKRYVRDAKRRRSIKGDV